MKVSQRGLFIIAIFFIICVAVFFRFRDLATNPPGLFADEAAIGYNAYTLAHFGTDEYGVRWPLFFRSFGDYRLPIPIYASLPFVWIFGLNEWSIRLAPALAGVISIVAIIFATGEITSKRTGLFTGFLLAVLPWHVLFSRWGMEYIYLIVLMSLGLWFYFLSYKKVKFLFFASIMFGLSMYSYYPALFVTPLFFGGILLHRLIFRKQNKPTASYKSTLLAIGIFCLFSLPLIPALLNGTLMTRWHSISSFNHGVGRSFQAKSFVTNYLNHYGLDFLFFKGDSGWKGHRVLRGSVIGMGVLYLFQLPLLMMGLYVMVRRRKPGFGVILWLLVLFPLGAAVALDVSSVRTEIGMIPLTIISAIGLDMTIQIILSYKYLLIRYVSIGVICVVVTVSTYRYGVRLFVEYPLKAEGYWGFQYGAREIVEYFIAEQAHYDVMYLMPAFNGPEIYFEFYDLQHRCRKCKVAGGTLDLDPKQHILFALSLGNIPFRIIARKIVYYPSGIPAFVIGEYVPKGSPPKL